MTQAFVIGVRILLVGLVAFWSYRLWVGTASWTARGVGILFSAAIAWQIVGGTL